MNDNFWYKLSRVIVKAGNMPFPVTDTLIELLKNILSEEEADFIIKVYNRKPNMNLNEIMSKIDIDSASLTKLLDDLQFKGVVVGTESKTTGITVYRLQPPFPGLFEFQLMRPKEGEHEKRLARLFDKLFGEWGKLTSQNYESLIPQYKNFPPIDHVVPVEKEVDSGIDIILSREDVKKLIDKYDDIAVALCYCRHEKDLIDEPCKIDAPRRNCFLFGKTAKFCIEKEFAEPISRDEAIKVLREAEDAGLIHKAFHIHQNPERDLEAICNCCNCCCGVFQLFNRGVMPFYTVSNYLAVVNDDDCIGCGTCEEKCPMQTIKLEDGTAVVNEEKCIGCGVCAHHCPEEAIHLKRFESRDVFIPPKKIEVE
ncbi:MAG: 4Fe-4S binding protein [Candidatus Hermodarchaeota archaeon]